MGVFERETLSNGLRVLTAPMPHVQSVACFVMLAAGSRYETPRDERDRALRRAHVLQGHRAAPDRARHRHRDRRDRRRVQRLHRQGVHGLLRRAARPSTARLALDVLVDMLRHSKFEPEEIDREKGVIVEEMNMYFDTPRDYIGGVYDSLLYGDQPLGWDIIGRKETVRAATRETFLDYIDRWYKPERMVVGFGGRIDGDVRAEVARAARRPRGRPRPARRRRSSSPANGGPRVKLHTKESDQAHLTLGVRSYPLVHPDRYALQVLATVLGTGMSSRLFTEVRERRGLAYYVFAANHAYTDAGSLYSQAGVDINRIDEAVSTIVGELKRIADEPVPVRRAREGEERREGPLRAPAREPARDDHVRAAARGARGRRDRARGGARRDRRGHGRGRPARGAGRDRLARAQPRADRARSTTPSASRSSWPDAPSVW